jgi:hypothetical protein
MAGHFDERSQSFGSFEYLASSSNYRMLMAVDLQENFFVLKGGSPFCLSHCGSEECGVRRYLLIDRTIITQISKESK